MSEEIKLTEQQNDASTLNAVSCAEPRKPLTIKQYVEQLRAKVVEYRQYEKQAREQRATIAEWFEGKADVYCECADILEYSILPHLMQIKENL